MAAHNNPSPPLIYAFFCVWKEGETENEFATAQTNGFVDGLAIEQARYLAQLVEPHLKYIINNHGHI